MSEEIKNEEIKAEAPEQQPEDATAKETKKKPRRTEAEWKALAAQVEESAAALAAAEDKYLRLAAEYDNFRRRSAKEKENLYADAYADALAVFLPVVDNLERAAQFADGESVAKGVAMTLKGMSDTLERLGITEIEAVGKPFDPEVHNAVLHIEDETLGESVVAEVLQKGYRKGDRVLRYAMVKVAN